MTALAQALDMQKAQQDNTEEIAGRVERLIAAARRWASTREDLGYQVGIGLSHIDREAEIAAWAAFREAATVLRACVQPEAVHTTPEDTGGNDA